MIRVAELSRVAVLLPVVGMAACANAPLRTYVLTDPGSQRAPVTAGPVIEIVPIRMPDHLDTSDMLTRSGTNELVASTSGRWGDRLSIGTRIALAEDLQALLRDAAVVTDSPDSSAAVRLDMNIPNFDLTSDRILTLNARWTIRILQAPAHQRQDGIRLVTGGVSAGDDAQAAAMSVQVAQLAARIAPEIRSALMSPP
jgi:uncharacterized lipoprotein YmbA